MTTKLSSLQVPAHTGPREPDGHNLWPHLMDGSASPRNEVITQGSNFVLLASDRRAVVNDYTESEGLANTTVIRVGNFKLIVGEPGDNRTIAWPTPGSQPVPFGQSNGTRNMHPGEDNHCRGPAAHGNTNGDCKNGCLFDLENDRTESKNLINDPSYSHIVANLTARLKEAAATGPPWAYPYHPPLLGTIIREVCASENKTHYFEPVREDTPPNPPPPPFACPNALKAKCPLPFDNYDDCLKCTRDYCGTVCTPKARQAYCKTL